MRLRPGEEQQPFDVAAQLRDVVAARDTSSRAASARSRGPTASAPPGATPAPRRPRGARRRVGRSPPNSTIGAFAISVFVRRRDRSMSAATNTSVLEVDRRVEVVLERSRSSASSRPPRRLRRRSVGGLRRRSSASAGAPRAGRSRAADRRASAASRADDTMLTGDPLASPAYRRSTANGRSAGSTVLSMASTMRSTSFTSSPTST